MTEPVPATREGDWLCLNIKARPGARQDRFRGVSAGLLQVDVAAKAEGGRATERLLGFLAESFGIPRRDVELISGAHARWKRVRLKGAKEMPEDLAAILPEPKAD